MLRVPFPRTCIFCCLLLPVYTALSAQNLPVPAKVMGYRDFGKQAKIDQSFLSVPNPAIAREELKTLTAAPHVAGSKEDYQTAVYVRDKFKAAGLDTQIVEYKAWMNLPEEVYVQATAANGQVWMTGPSREHVDDDPYQNDARILPAFHGSSPSGDVTADVVYANYGRPEDFKMLQAMHIDVRGKIVMVRYGDNFRGVKVYIAQEKGAAGVIIYSDPADDGYARGPVYPNGPWRPDTGIERGAVQYLFKYPGDATTPGVASTPELPPSARLPAIQAANLPAIPSMPLSYRDAAPILEHMGGSEAPKNWQGALPFAYHLGGVGAVRVHMRLKMDYAERPIWDVIGTLAGTDFPDEWVVTGNHRDAWVYGAVDPGSGTVAMLEAVRGVGSLLQKGWKPKRTMYFCSWDAEEEGLIGSTEWVEDHAPQLLHAVAYLNTDVSVSGPNFEASAVPSLKQFIRDITMEVASPRGGSVYDEWKKTQTAAGALLTGNPFDDSPAISQISGDVMPGDTRLGDVRLGDLGSGSDYTAFLQHLGVPSTDIGTVGPYGVYHSTFDDYTWFVRNADPDFVYEQEIARVLGLEALHMADADVLPYDYVTYGMQIGAYIESAQIHAEGEGLSGIDFTAGLEAAKRFTAAAAAAAAISPDGNQRNEKQRNENRRALDASLRSVETDLLSPQGLPGRPWFKHTAYAPGEYTGYAAVVIPGVNEAIDAHDLARAQAQMEVLKAALTRASMTLEAIH